MNGEHDDPHPSETGSGQSGGELFPTEAYKERKHPVSWQNRSSWRSKRCGKAMEKAVQNITLWQFNIAIENHNV